MKSTLLLSICISILLLNLACKKKIDCERERSCYMTETEKKYFGNYKPGYMWIYSNQDASKMDSIYVEDYQWGWHDTQNKDCIKWIYGTMKVKNTYLSSDPLIAKYTNFNCEGFFSFITTIPICEFQSTSDASLFADTKRIDSLSLPNNEVHYDVIFQKRMWFAPEVGLIKYVTSDKKDTFFLQNLMIP